MPLHLPDHFIIHPNVARGLKEKQPVVALESAVITHGLPRPINLETAKEMQEIICAEGVIPATIALLDGIIHIGLTDAELAHLANLDGTRKISRRDFGYAIAGSLSGGTTVAGTMIAASIAGIKVFATGGIGGVHRDAPFDVSADLYELGRTSMVVVCAGAKAILDLPATMEVLETNGVMVAGYQTSELPAFYSITSGIHLDARMDTPEEIVKTASGQWELGLKGSLLILQPVPNESAIPAAEIDGMIASAVAEAKIRHIHGPSTTPFLLERVNTLTAGRSMTANLALLKNNALLAAKIAKAFSHNQIIRI
jgi:pseudouridylate synthase